MSNEKGRPADSAGFELARSTAALASLTFIAIFAAFHFVIATELRQTLCVYKHRPPTTVAYSHQRVFTLSRTHTHTHKVLSEPDK